PCHPPPPRGRAVTRPRDSAWREPPAAPGRAPGRERAGPRATGRSRGLLGWVEWTDGWRDEAGGWQAGQGAFGLGRGPTAQVRLGVHRVERDVGRDDDPRVGQQRVVERWLGLTVEDIEPRGRDDPGVECR